MILPRFLIKFYVGRYIGPYHRRIPISLTRTSRSLIAYCKHCRLQAGAQVFAKTVVQDLSEAGTAAADVDAVTEKIAGRFPRGNISMAVDHIAAQAAIGRLCIVALRALDIANWRNLYAPLLRRVFISGLGMHLGQTNADLVHASQVLIEMEPRSSDPTIFETWDRQRRRFLAGLIVGDAMAEDFLAQHRSGVRKPKPAAEISDLFSNYIMFDSADTSTKGTTLPLKAQPAGPEMTPGSPQ